MRTIKRTLKTIACSIIITLSFSACMQDELVDEADLVENVADNSAKYTAVPCDFDLSNLQPNANIVLKCVIDLAGATVTLPDNVTLDRVDGDIRNGTLIFGANSMIDGGLLNRTLTIGGRPPKVKNSTFIFIPSRWGIVEGETTSDIAQNNNNILEKAMLKVKEMGISTFKINEMDAYFEVSQVTSTTTNQNFYAVKEAINIPSDFTLEMSDNTILRVFPTVGDRAATLIGIDDVSNVTVKGGILYGDRDLRQYSVPNEEHGSHLLSIRSGKNVVLDGITFTMGSVGGLNINSYGFSFQPEYNPTDNVLVKNCVFDQIRMMSVAITDGRNILIENNEFIDSSNPTQNSDGGVVGYALNIEPIRTRDASGALVYYQRVQDVIIRENIERGSRVGSFTIFVGDNIIIEDNDLESMLSWSFAQNSKVRNNLFTSAQIGEGTAILAAGTGDTVFNNEISGNMINNYGTGLNDNHGRLKIFDNDITNCGRGIVINGSEDLEIFNNNINSDRSGSSGIYFQITRANDVLINNNEVNVITNAVRAVDLNQNEEDNNNLIIIENNQFTSSVVSQLTRASGLRLNNNFLNGRVQLSNSDNTVFDNNTINSTDGHGISLNNINTNITIQGNSIENPGNFDCIYFSDNTDPNEVIVENNLCN